MLAEMRAAFRATEKIEPAKLGRAEIRVREVDTVSALRAWTKGARLTEGERVVSLHVNGRLVMSDTYNELRLHDGLLRAASGTVLMNGLGLGCALRALLVSPAVEHVDVVEIERDVIDLVAPLFDDYRDRVTFHHADAHGILWPQGKRWDTAWHDVWPDLCLDDLADHTRLLRRYGRRVGWQRCWGHEALLAYRGRGR